MRAFVVFLLCLSGCGYHFQKADERMTLSIPYVKGDQEGQLTNELIRQFVRCGAYEYLREDGDLLLKVAIVGATSEKIGFRYDRNQTSGAVETNLMPTENRRTVTAEVSLVHAGTEEVVAGPYKIAASVDYDYTDVNSIQSLAFVTPTGQKEKVLNYSLGQVDSPEGAHDDATVPLYRNLAQQIVAAVLNHVINRGDK